MGFRRRREVFWTAFKLGSWQACCGLSVACPKPASSLLMGLRRRREVFWTAFKPSSAAGRPVAASLWPVRSLPPLFLWASEGDVRHFGPPSNPRVKQLAKPSRTLPSTSKGLSEASPAGRPAAASLWPVRGLPPRQLAGLLRPLCGLSEACLLSSYGHLKATLGILDRLQTLLGSRQACCGLSVARHFGPPSNPRVKQLAKPSRILPSTSKGLSEASPAGRPAAASLSCLLSRQLAGLLRPLCGLSEACLLSSYGHPKATLGILDRLQTLSAAGRRR